MDPDSIETLQSNQRTNSHMHMSAIHMLCACTSGLRMKTEKQPTALLRLCLLIEMPPWQA